LRPDGTLDGMEVVPHADVGEFARLARPLLEPDPLRHTSVLTVLNAVCHKAFVPMAMLTVHDGGAVVGALLRTDGWPALVSGVPARCAPAVVEALLKAGADAVGALGPVLEADAFAAAWTARTGGSVADTVRLRLFALDKLRALVGVPGSARLIGPADGSSVDRLAAWRAAFEIEVHGEAPTPPPKPDDVVASLAAGAAELLWEVDGVPVAQATARAVTAGMSRIGPVYTPPEHRGHGYAAAVTAAASRCALDRGARHVLLYTDLANPTSNRLYPRLGYRPRYDALELRFARE
jgi:GNAT superfamily N-acetyltransferase